MASVRIESKAFTDARLKVLAKKLNINWHHALGVMLDLWRECTESEVYHLDPETIDALAEIEGFSFSMVESGLGRIQKNGKIYLVGTKGKTDWLAERRESSRKGGEANRKRIRESKKAIKAQLLLEKNGEPNGEPNGSPPTPTPTPTPTLSLEDEETNFYSSSSSSSNDLNAVHEMIDFSEFKTLKLDFGKRQVERLFEAGIDREEIQTSIKHFASALRNRWQPKGGFRSSPLHYFMGCMLGIDGRFRRG